MNADRAVALATTQSVLRGDLVVGSWTTKVDADPDAFDVHIDRIAAAGGRRVERWRYRTDREGGADGGPVGRRPDVDERQRRRRDP